MKLFSNLAWGRTALLSPIIPLSADSQDLICLETNTKASVEHAHAILNYYANPNGWSALNYAIEMVRFLLAKGANPNFWIDRSIQSNKNIHEVFKSSPLHKDLRLLNENPTFQQQWYQLFLIHILMDFGAVAP